MKSGLVLVIILPYVQTLSQDKGTQSLRLGSRCSHDNQSDVSNQATVGGLSHVWVVCGYTISTKCDLFCKL